MKKIFFLAALLLGFSSGTMAQDYAKLNYEYQEKSSTFYLGFGGGINNYLGLIGPSVEYQFAQNFTGFGGLGLGSWGNKASIGVRYYSNFPKGWAFGAGLSFSGGQDDVIYKMPENTLVGVSGEADVAFNLNPTSTFNLTATRFWQLGSSGKNRFNIELGYAFALKTRPFTVVDSRIQLNRNGFTYMDILQPGGVILGLGFSFGLN